MNTVLSPSDVATNLSDITYEELTLLETLKLNLFLL